MSLSLLPTQLALAPNAKAQFNGTGGTAPYTYSAVSGSIDASSGLYTAPSSALIDTVTVTDSLGATAQTSVKVQVPIMLVCEIIQHELNLDDSQVYLWNQKVDIPSDSNLYVVVGIQSVKPFGSSWRFNGSSNDSDQAANFQATLSVDIFSRSAAARDQKELVLMALGSAYAQSQMEANSFYIAPISTGFVNLSHEEGAAILYRFNISVNIQYAVPKAVAVPYYDTFDDASVTTEP